MPTGARYPSQHITDEDKEFIDNSYTNFVILQTIILTKYPNPQKFSLKIDKLIEMKKTKLTIHSMSYMLGDFKGNILKPEYLRNYLSDKLINSQSDAGRTLPAESKIGTIDSRDLRQYVFKNFENYGYLLNYKGKEKGKQLIKSHRGRPSLGAPEHRGGNPSIYKLADRLEYYKSLVEKPECIDYLYDKLKNSKFFKEVIKYQLKAGLYLDELNRKVILDALNFDSEIFKIEKPQEMEDNKANPTFLNTIIDTHIDKLVELSMDHLENHKKQYCEWVLSLGLKSNN